MKLIRSLIYKIKFRLYMLSKDAKKIRRPSYENLKKHEAFQKDNQNKFIMSFGAGRSGQNWFAKIFNSHPNWIGTLERFSDFEAFYRFINYYELAIDKEGFFKLLKLASNRDMAKYQNTFIASPYFCFGAEELSRKLNPDFIFFHIRNPINSVESFHRKNWYNNSYYFDYKSPLFDISTSMYRSFSRIVPKEDFLHEWVKLTRIGKIAWFWATANKSIYDDFLKIKETEKFFVKLEDVNQNYDVYQGLSNKFNFKRKMSKKDYFKILNKTRNRGPSDKHRYKDWSSKEKKEFDKIIEKIFPNYEKIKTNL